MKVYISGAITGCKNYYETFHKAEKRLRERIYECPVCGEKVAGKVSLCKCGQRLKWGD